MLKLMSDFYYFSEAEVFSFGKSARGRLGRSDPETMTPKRINIVSDELFSVVSISCSHGSTLLATRRKFILFAILMRCFIIGSTGHI